MPAIKLVRGHGPLLQIPATFSRLIEKWNNHPPQPNQPHHNLVKPQKLCYGCRCFIRINIE